VPGGLAILVEVTSFALMALFIARMGTAALAAHQVASNVCATLYMMPLSMGIATSARVGYWLGRGDAAAARRALSIGLRMAIALALGLASLLWLVREPLANVYAATPAVAALAASLLAWVSVYHLADTMQAVSVFVLRCYRVTFVPLAVYGVLLWGIGLAGGYALTYRGVGDALPPLGIPQAFWMTGSSALMITGIAFVLLLRYHARQPQPARS
jgi:MATE family multidrug resistance protein